MSLWCKQKQHSDFQACAPQCLSLEMFWDKKLLEIVDEEPAVSQFQGAALFLADLSTVQQSRGAR